MMLDVIEIEVSVAKLMNKMTNHEHVIVAEKVCPRFARKGLTKGF